MSGVAEVQARVASLQHRVASLAGGGRAAVDPLAAEAFARSLREADQARAAAGSAGSTSPSTSLSSALSTPYPTSLSSVGSTALLPAAPSGSMSATGSTALSAALSAVAAGSATSASKAVAGTAPSAPAAPGGPVGADVVAAARRYLGVPYLWGGTDPAVGLDCSGFVQRTFADLGVDLPRTVADQRHAGTAVASMSQARPGDLLVFDSSRSPSGRHIGIYVGDGQMIEAPSKGKDVRVAPVRDEVTSIRRVVPAEAAPAPAPSAAARPTWAAGTDLTSLFQQATARYGLPEGLLQAVAQKESGLRTDAVSPAGARGLMQLMPATAAGLGVDPMDPAQAVDGGARYLREQLDAFGSLPLALAAYNAGPGNVRRHGGIPPFQETRDYVASITAALGQGRRA